VSWLAAELPSRLEEGGGPGERYELSALRKQGLRPAAIARALGRHRSTICREIQRNSRKDGGYRPSTADDFARWRRSRSRRNQRFTAADWALVETWLREDFSPEQVSGWLRRFRLLRISHETIYRHVWTDKGRDGTLHRHLRCAQKKRRKRYGRYDSRGRLAGKRTISKRPPGAQNRSRVGHLEGDTVLGTDKHCLLTLVDRKTGFTIIGKLKARTVEATNRRAIELINNAHRNVRSVTVDNGTEFHGYKAIEASTGADFYFATPHHSWERGTNENTNGLIRQYAPKRTSLAQLTQVDCDAIAQKLNNRPRKRLGFRTPAECFLLRAAA
jgi:IS30 family transposase